MLKFAVVVESPAWEESTPRAAVFTEKSQLGERVKSAGASRDEAHRQPILDPVTCTHPKGCSFKRQEGLTGQPKVFTMAATKLKGRRGPQKSHGPTQSRRREAWAEKNAKVTSGLENGEQLSVVVSAAEEQCGGSLTHMEIPWEAQHEDVREPKTVKNTNAHIFFFSFDFGKSSSSCTALLRILLQFRHVYGSIQEFP